MRTIIRWGVVWAVHVGLWLIYVSQIQTWEILVGSAAAGLATLGLAVLCRLRLVRFRPSIRQIAEAWRSPLYIVLDTWKLIRCVGTQAYSRSRAPSCLTAVPFEVGPDNPACAGRRALAVLYTTMTPNSVVIGIVREQGLMLYHQIIPGDALQITRNLGANA